MIHSQYYEILSWWTVFGFIICTCRLRYLNALKTSIKICLHESPVEVYNTLKEKFIVMLLCTSTYYIYWVLNLWPCRMAYQHEATIYSWESTECKVPSYTPYRNNFPNSFCHEFLYQRHWWVQVFCSLKTKCKIFNPVLYHPANVLCLDHFC